MISARSVVMAFFLALIWWGQGIAEERGMTEAVQRVGELFPEISGSLSLREKVSGRLPDLGVQLVNYDVLLEGKKLGEVTRIIALRQEGLAARVDMLVRYDDQGAVQGVVLLKPLKEGEDITRLLWSFRGLDFRVHHASLASMIVSVAAGAELDDGVAPPAPEGGYPVTVRQLLLEAGAQLPALKVRDLAGKTFDSSDFRKTKLLISFLSPESPRSGEMAQAIENMTAQALQEEKVALLHVIRAPSGTAADYAGVLGLTGQAATDPAGLLASMFQVPYSPYLFLFNRGTLAAPVTWEGEEKLQKALREFLNPGTSGRKGAAK